VPDQPTILRLGPWSGWQWLGLAGVVVLVLLSSIFAYHRGQLAAGVDAAALVLERREASTKAARLEAENARLNAKVAELEMARQLDREAYGQVEKTLGDLQSQLSRQGDDLAFYRSIVSPEDGVQGLRIHRFEVQPGATAGEYQLKLTLIQSMRHESVAAGLAQLVIHGMQGERPARHTVGELLGRPQAQLPFSFRYFQTIERAVALPEGFQAFEVEVQVRSSKLRAPMQQSFPWKVGGAQAVL
jgi:hypothetical protein